MYKVAIIGGGIIGISSGFAIKNLKTNVQVTIFAERLSPYTTSDIAAGLWTPYALQETSNDKILQWSRATLDYILHLWKEGQASPAGISLQSVLALSEEANFQVPEWRNIALGFYQLDDEKVKEFGVKYGRQFTGGYSYTTFTLEASRFIPFLLKQFECDIHMGKIVNFEQLSRFDVTVNCTGLAAKELAQDETMSAIRGQIIRVKAPWQYQTILLQSPKLNYIIPNCDSIILGGTHQEDNYNETINNDDSKNIQDGCLKLVPNLKNGTVIEHRVGLRPGRVSVRLEMEMKNNLKIVHNYGHGGSGITLSIGCALECARIIKNLLKMKCKIIEYNLT